MTEYINHTNTKSSFTEGEQVTCIDLPDTSRGTIARACIYCFNLTADRKTFLACTEVIKQLYLPLSETPTLDAAYVDGIITILTAFKQEAA